MATEWEDRGRYGGSDYGNERGRGSRRGGGDRDWTDRAGDEVRSWLGDEDAERRRRMEDGRRYGMRDDDRFHRGGYRDEYGSGGSYADRGPGGTGSYGGFVPYDNVSRGGYGGNQSYGGYSGRGASGPDYGDERWSGRSGQGNYRGQENYRRQENYRGQGNYGGGRGSEDRGFLERAGDEVASWFGDEDAERRREMDARHRGRGPKNYTRSDDRIREDVSDRLSDDPHIDASEIEVSVDNGEVTLSGTVNERFAKRHAEDLAERCSGVKHVQNNLRISAQHTSGGSSAGTAGGTSAGTSGGMSGATAGSTSAQAGAGSSTGRH